MNISIWILGLFMGLSFCLGIVAHILCVKKNIKISEMTNSIRANWFWIVFSVVLLYVMMNFHECIDLHFTEDFNGKNLIFLLLIVLSILPMFECIKANGISLKFYNQSKEIKKSEDSYKKAITNAETKALRDKNRQGGKRR